MNLLVCKNIDRDNWVNNNNKFYLFQYILKSKNLL